MASFNDEVRVKARACQWDIVTGTKHDVLIPPGGLTDEYPKGIMIARGHQSEAPRYQASVLTELRRHSDAGRVLAEQIRPQPPKKTEAKAPPSQRLAALPDPEGPVAVYGQYTASIEVVTPEQGAKYLERIHPQQRRLSEPHVRKLAKSKTKGQWQGPTTDALGFDVDGWLINGMHRLSADVKSGTTSVYLVLRGLPAAVYDVIDGGKSRSLADRLHGVGATDCANLGATISRLYQFVHAGLMRDGGSVVGQDRPTMMEHFEFFLKYREVIEDSVPMRRSLYTAHKFAPGFLGCFVVLARTADREVAEGFFAEMLLPGGEEGTPTTMLKSALYKRSQTDSRRRDSDITYAAMMIKAYNLYARGERRQVLSWRVVEPFPQLHDPEDNIAKRFKGAQPLAA